MVVNQEGHTEARMEVNPVYDLSFRGRCLLIVNVMQQLIFQYWYSLPASYAYCGQHGLIWQCYFHRNTLELHVLPQQCRNKCGIFCCVLVHNTVMPSNM